MKLCAKSKQPVFFRAWKTRIGRINPPTYSGDLRGQIRQRLFDDLLSNQGYVCCYCGRALRPERDDSHIEHFWPQSHFDAAHPPDLTLSYRNLFISCGPASLPSRPNFPNTCGDAKHDWHDKKTHIKPSDSSCEKYFRYGASGSIFPRGRNKKSAKKMIDILKLDHALLDYERSQAILYAETILGNTKNKRRYRALISDWRSKDAFGKLKSFGHAVANYLEDELSYL